MENKINKSLCIESELYMLWFWQKWYNTHTHARIWPKWIRSVHPFGSVIHSFLFIFRRQNCRYVENNVRIKRIYDCNMCIVNIKLVLCPFRFPHNNKWKRFERCTNTHTLTHSLAKNTYTRYKSEQPKRVRECYTVVD